MAVKQTSIFQIHDAVMRVSEEAKRLWRSKPVMASEKLLLSELITCILSSQERFEVAIGARKHMDALGVLRIPTGEEEFRKLEDEIKYCFAQPIPYSVGGTHYERKIRFNNNKTDYITKTLRNLYLNGHGLKGLLDLSIPPIDVRKNLIKTCFGVGPKQASMFLRNIRYYGQLAILDKHVIDYMDIMAIGQCTYNIGRLSDYEKVEMHLQQYAQNYDVELLHLDVAIWTTMRVLKGIV